MELSSKGRWLHLFYCKHITQGHMQKKGPTDAGNLGPCHDDPQWMMIHQVGDIYISYNSYSPANNLCQ